MPKPKRRPGVLTPRMTEVAHLYAQGYTYQDIADRLEISYGTVSSTLTKVYQTLDVHSVEELRQAAAQRKQIESEEQALAFVVAEFVMRSHGRPFTRVELMEAVKLPKSTASLRLRELCARKWIVRRGSTYRMSLSFRNMLMAAGRSLVPSQIEVGA